LLSADLLRRDQIWLVEKDKGHASHVYPLTDFAPRKKEALERGYLSGRYGGIPVLKRHGSSLDVEKLLRAAFALNGPRNRDPRERLLSFRVLEFPFLIWDG
jgi:hypothetical protein